MYVDFTDLYSTIIVKKAYGAECTGPVANKYVLGKRHEAAVCTDDLVPDEAMVPSVTAGLQQFANLPLT